MKNLLVLTALLVGAAHAQPVTCNAGKDCEKKWARALQATEMLSNMRIQIANDTRIQTYPPSGYSSVGIVVNKAPTDLDHYEITMRVECYTRSTCEKVEPNAQKLFRMHLSDPAEANSPSN